MRNPPKKEIGRLRELEAMLPKLQTKEPQPWQSPNCQPTKAGPMTLTAAPQGFPPEDFDRIEQAQNNLYSIDQHIKEVRAEMATMLDTQGNIKVDAFALQLNLMYEIHGCLRFWVPD